MLQQGSVKHWIVRIMSKTAVQQQWSVARLDLALFFVFLKRSWKYGSLCAIWFLNNLKFQQVNTGQIKHIRRLRLPFRMPYLHFFIPSVLWWVWACPLILDTYGQALHMCTWNQTPQLIPPIFVFLQMFYFSCGDTAFSVNKTKNP